MRSLEEKQENIKKLSLVNGCSDEYTVVPLDDITAKYEHNTNVRMRIKDMCGWILIWAAFVDPITGQQLDSRYYYTGGAISELDVQHESGVLYTLAALPMYEYYAGRFYAANKGGKVYHMWMRPTISWMLDCEE